MRRDTRVQNSLVPSQVQVAREHVRESDAAVQVHAVQRVLQESQGLHGARVGAPLGEHGAARGAEHQHQGGDRRDDGDGEADGRLGAEEGERQVGGLGGAAGQGGETGGGHYRQGEEGVRGSGRGGQQAGLQQEIDRHEFV